MFDQNQQFPQSQPASQPQTQAVPPQNGILGQPQSPFLTPVEAAARQAGRTAAPAPVEDMFGSTEPQEAARPYGQPAQFPAAGQMQAGNIRPISEAELFGGRSFSFGRAITVAIILLIILLAGGAAYFGYGYVQSLNKAAQNNLEKTPGSLTPPIDSNNDQGALAASSTPATSTSAKAAAGDTTDSDGDGLTDSEESSLTTDPLKADSDSDGLTDWAEIKIYKTNPLNADTDGDTYKDGQEVINGYDPAKPGNAKLFSVPQQ